VAENMENKDYGSPEIFYSQYYKKIIFGNGIGPKSIKNTHRAMEKLYADKFFNKVLEIGGGNGEHLDFVQHGYNQYFLTDIHMPELKEPWSNDFRITCEIQNAERLSFVSSSFDRVIVTCLLHHVEKPEKVMQEILRVLKPDGVATIFLSCDPGLVVRMIRSITTAREAKKEGFHGYKLMISREHRNHIASLLQMVRYVFRSHKTRISFYPFRIPSWNLNGYVVVHISAH
jgi:SAM-dependent methyltransferase